MALTLFLQSHDLLSMCSGGYLWLLIEAVTQRLSYSLMKASYCQYNICLKDKSEGN